MALPKQVCITEVGPRDGLQNEASFISTKEKIAFIDKLSQTGLTSIETTSFVSPKSIPQLADSLEVYQGIQKYAGVKYSALVPNDTGMQSALSVNVQKICVFTAVSETFTQKNIHCSIEESLERFKVVLSAAKQHAIPVRGYISCALGCPYEGNISPERTSALAEQLMTLGCDEISLGDTIGVGTPEKVKTLIQIVTKKIPLEKLAMHFHDTYGQAIANIYASLEMGVSAFDSSVSGLGGCPYAKGASGNVATEDVIYLMDELGINTGVNLKKLVDAGNFISEILKRPNASKTAHALVK